MKSEFIVDDPTNIPATFGSNWPITFRGNDQNVKCLSQMQYIAYLRFKKNINVINITIYSNKRKPYIVSTLLNPERIINRLCFL